MPIDWIEVESSNIAAIAYVKEEEEMLVQFNNSRVYSYSDVTVEVFESFKAADSKGKYFNEHIKGVYDYQRIS